MATSGYLYPHAPLAGAPPFLCPCVDPTATSGYLHPRTRVAGASPFLCPCVDPTATSGYLYLRHTSWLAVIAHVRPRPQTHCVTVPHRPRHIVEGRYGGSCVCGLTSSPLHQPPRCWPAPRQCSPFRAASRWRLQGARQRGPHRVRWRSSSRCAPRWSPWTAVTP